MAPAVVLVMLVMFGLAGCGSSNDQNPAPQTAAQACPTTSTKSFAKTRFVADVGLIAGSFHRWIWKPYQAGSFKKGAEHRFVTIAKAAATAVFINHELKNALSNVKASPGLCKVLYTPLQKVTVLVNDLSSNLRHGNLGTLAGVNAGLGGITSLLASNGSPVTETSKS